jgi:deoxyribonuclease-4
LRFGFHISISGGLGFVADRAKALKCDCAQIFSRNPRGWQYTPLKKEEVEEFKKTTTAVGLQPIAIHIPYLPNLASPDKQLYRQSVDSLTEELRRAELLGLPWVVTHVGKAMGQSEPDALKRVTEALSESLSNVPGKTLILLENTAGQGTEVGYRFEHIAQIMKSVVPKNRLGICLDTCHAFAAGYDMATEKGLEKALKEIDSSIGLSRLYMLHLNDSKGKLGSRLDRHWHIGEGFIGKEGFRLIINYSLLRNLPGVMETPRGENEDRRNMRAIRALIAANS